MGKVLVPEGPAHFSHLGHPIMTVFLFVLTQKRVMAHFNDNVLGLMRVTCGTRVTLLSFSTREYGIIISVCECLGLKVLFYYLLRFKK